MSLQCHVFYQFFFLRICSTIDFALVVVVSLSKYGAFVSSVEPLTFAVSFSDCINMRRYYCIWSLYYNKKNKGWMLYLPFMPISFIFVNGLTIAIMCYSLVVTWCLGVVLLYQHSQCLPLRTVQKSRCSCERLQILASSFVVLLFTKNRPPVLFIGIYWVKCLCPLPGHP